MLGRTVEEAKASLSLSAYRDWQLYWIEEPWGPFRDNLHAAIVAAQVQALRSKKGSRIKLDQFMVMDPSARRRENRAGFIAMLRFMGRSRGDVKRATKGRPKAKAKGRR